MLMELVRYVVIEAVYVDMDTYRWVGVQLVCVGELMLAPMIDCSKQWALETVTLTNHCSDWGYQ